MRKKVLVIVQSNTLNRYEMKYWVDLHVAERLEEYLEHFMDLDANSQADGSYHISSLYLDTKDKASYYEKYDGDYQRDKYRIRMYNGNPETLIFEIKSKRNYFIHKHRNVFESKKVEDRATDGSLEEIPIESFMETPSKFGHAIRRLSLEPAVWVGYQRKAYVAKNNQGLRLTFDRGLKGIDAHEYRIRHHELDDYRISRWRERVILEIKFNNHLPFWLETVVQQLNLQQNSISKYGLCLNRFYFRNWRERTWTH